MGSSSKARVRTADEFRIWSRRSVANVGTGPVVVPEELPGALGDPDEGEQLTAFATAQRMTGPSQQQGGLVIRESRDRKIVGAGHAARDQARRGRAADEGVQDVRARGLAGLGEHAC